MQDADVDVSEEVMDLDPETEPTEVSEESEEEGHGSDVEETDESAM